MCLSSPIYRTATWGSMFLWRRGLEKEDSSLSLSPPPLTPARQEGRRQGRKSLSRLTLRPTTDMVLLLPLPPLDTLTYSARNCLVSVNSPQICAHISHTHCTCTKHSPSVGVTPDLGGLCPGLHGSRRVPHSLLLLGPAPSLHRHLCRLQGRQEQRTLVPIDARLL